MKKVSDDRSYDVPNVLHVYFGVYDGSTKPADKESAGMLYYKLSAIDDEITSMPSQFTDDLIKLFAEYKEQLMSFVGSLV